LDALFAAVRALCDGSQMASSDGSLIAQSIQGSIERFFDQWYTEWGISIGKGPGKVLVLFPNHADHQTVDSHHTSKFSSLILVSPSTAA
jgi:hypothetical protein